MRKAGHSQTLYKLQVTRKEREHKNERQEEIRDGIERRNKNEQKEQNEKKETKERNEERQKKRKQRSQRRNAPSQSGLAVFPAQVRRRNVAQLKILDSGRLDMISELMASFIHGGVVNPLVALTPVTYY